MITACTGCQNPLTPYERMTVLGREGLCAGCATTAMIMGGMSPRLASLYYENGHDDAPDGGYRNDGDELVLSGD